MSEKKIKLTKLLTSSGEILDRDGIMDFATGIYDNEGNFYPAGFSDDGTAYGNSGDESGQILYENGRDTGYNINENYFSLVCLRVVHSKFRKTA